MKSPPNGLRGVGRMQSLCPTIHIQFPRCPWCGKKRGLTHAEFFSTPGGHPWDKTLNAYPLYYPGNYDMTVVVFSHAECGPDGGYAVSLELLAADPDDWFRQLTQKTWGARHMIEFTIEQAIRYVKKCRYVTWVPKYMRAGSA